MMASATATATATVTATATKRTVHLFHNFAAMAKHIAPFKHVESAARLDGIERALRPLWDDCVHHVVTDPLPRETFVTEYGEKEVARWEAAVASAASSGRPFTDRECGDIYWSKDSMNAVGIAANAAVSAVQTVLDSSAVEHAFAIVRPPGHHCFDAPAGFCIANNVVLAAQSALDSGKKVAIIDWDYHFGDGTASRFQTFKDVMFVSLHASRSRATNSATYPADNPLKGSTLALLTHGRSFSICWSYDDANDAAYLYAMETTILPALRRFAPDVILVSAGYDALRGDMLAGMELTPPVFRTLSSMLCGVGVPVVCVLEGGYDPDLLGAGVVETLRGLMTGVGAPSGAAADASPLLEKHQRVVDRVRTVLAL